MTPTVQDKIWAVLDKCNGKIESKSLCAAFPQYKANTVVQAFARWNKKHKLMPEQVIPDATKAITIDLMEQIVLAELKTATGKLKQDYVRYAMDLLKYKQPIAKVEDSDETEKLMAFLEESDDSNKLETAGDPTPSQ